MTYLNTTQAINNIANDLNICELILISAIKLIGNQTIDYGIWIDWRNGGYTIKVETLNNICVNRYLLDTPQKTEEKLKWLINKYDINVTSVTYLGHYASMQCCAYLFSTDCELEYTIESIPSGYGEVSVAFQVEDEYSQYHEFLTDYQDFLQMLNGHNPPLKILLPQESPQKFFRNKKLTRLGIV